MRKNFAASEKLVKKDLRLWPSDLPNLPGQLALHITTYEPGDWAPAGAAVGLLVVE